MGRITGNLLASHMLHTRVIVLTLIGCALQVYTYHGPERNSSVPFLEQHDIVITTYSNLTGERSMRNGLLKVMHHTITLFYCTQYTAPV